MLLLAALPAAGCGLADYENKMRETDARLQRFDEENKVLGDPLQLPGGDAATPAAVFLRPPKGVAAKAAAPEKGDPPFQYRFPAAPGAAVCTDVYLMFKNRGDDKKDLKSDIEGWLHATGASWQPYAAQPLGRGPTAFEAAQLNDPAAPPNAPAVFRAYVHQAADGAPVAVLFRFAQPPPAGADEAVKLSLDTYADSAEAQKARDAYGRRKSAGP